MTAREGSARCGNRVRIVRAAGEGGNLPVNAATIREVDSVVPDIFRAVFRTPVITGVNPTPCPAKGHGPQKALLTPLAPAHMMKPDTHGA